MENIDILSSIFITSEEDKTCYKYNIIRVFRNHLTYDDVYLCEFYLFPAWVNFSDISDADKVPYRITPAFAKILSKL